MNQPLIKVWYVSPQRLCNMHCSYCVSIGDYAKSGKFNWANDDEYQLFKRTLEWLTEQPFRLSVRLGTLGEPFASNEFLEQTISFGGHPNVSHIELLTNGSLLKKRFKILADKMDLTKLSLWVTHHPTEISIERFFENVSYVVESYGVKCVVNGLLFPDSVEDVILLRAHANELGLSFNLDLGYDPLTAVGVWDAPWDMMPFVRANNDVTAATQLGLNSEMLDIISIALQKPRGQRCSAGHKYIYIGINGDVFPCSKYFILNVGKLGNVTDPNFRYALPAEEWRSCEASSGCCNKEDFLNLEIAQPLRANLAKSGWIGT